MNTEANLAMTLDDLVFMPTYLSVLMYPGGFPMNVKSVLYSDFQDLGMLGSLHDIIHHYYGWVVSEPKSESPSQLIFEVLREYCIYYAHAPCWLMNPDPMPGFELWVKQSFEIKDWDTLAAWRMKAMDFGLNPF